MDHHIIIWLTYHFPEGGRGRGIWQLVFTNKYYKHRKLWKTWILKRFKIIKYVFVLQETGDPPPPPPPPPPYRKNQLIGRILQYYVNCYLRAENSTIFPGSFGTPVLKLREFGGKKWKTPFKKCVFLFRIFWRSESKWKGLGSPLFQPCDLFYCNWKLNWMVLNPACMRVVTITVSQNIFI